ncbi:response regulator, partial [bacterium]|nr:response regulator [bacterium]
PPTGLLPEPPGGLPPDTKLHAALPTPPAIPRPPRREVSAPTPPPRPHRAVVTADAVLASLDHVVWSVSPDGRLVFLLGGAVERVLGRPADVFLDTADGWAHAVPETDRPALRAAFARLPETGSFAVEHRVGAKRVVSRGRLVRRPDGVPVRVDGTTTEVAESDAGAELLAKLAAAEERLREAGRLGTLGRLMTGVAHDFNNCLTVISGNAQLLRECLPPGDALRERADEILTHVGSAAGVTRQLVAFGRPTTSNTGPTCPNAEVRGLERLLRRLVGNDITLDVLLAPGVQPVPVGAGALTQVLLNLVANARDATPGRGTVTVRTAEAPGRFVALTVTDTGVGMSAAVKARMFDPYFTTKGASGNGVGLATVAEIVRGAGGHIEVESLEGWGTSVRVYFPAAAAGLPAAVPPPPPTAPARLETVLLVQDGTAVRDLSAVALQHAGYRVLEADDGAAGEERARLYAGPIDLLVTDVELPKQDGRQLAAALCTARPGLKVLFVSGAAPPTPGALLSKPYTAAELLAAVRTALDG